VPGLPDRSHDSHPAPVRRTPGYAPAQDRFIMMRRLPDRRLRAFAEAEADLRPPTIFSHDNATKSQARFYGAHVRPSHFPLSPMPQAFRHTRMEGQKYIQIP